MLGRSRIRNRTRYYNEGGGPVQGALLLEDGSFLTTEDGGYILL